MFLLLMLNPFIMKTLKFLIILFITFCISTPFSSASNPVGEDSIQVEQGPGNYLISTDQLPVRIPFELFRMDIRMIAEINEKEVYMLIDNGSLWDDLLFFGSPKIDSLGLNRGGEAIIGGAGEGDKVKSDMAEDITLKFPGIEFNNQTAIILPYIPGTPNLWEGADGQVSNTFFKHFIVEINYDNWEIILHNRDNYQYKGKGKEITMKPGNFASYKIPVTLTMFNEDEISVDLQLDLGGVQPLDLMVAPGNGITLPEKNIPSQLGYGIQGPIEGYIGRLKNINIAGYEIDSVIAGYTVKDHAEDPYANLQVGMPVLSRFNLIFDYFNEKMYIEPNHRFELPFEYNMTGLELRSNIDGNYKVNKVIPDSPADIAGIKVGDLITKINNYRAAETKLWKLHSIFKKECQVLKINLLRNSEELEVKLTLKRLI